MKETPWTRARKLKSEQQEARIGKMEGGERQNNSGRFWRWKRDAKLWNFLVEARTTDKDTYRISRKEWMQLRKQAFQTPPGMLPAMQIDLQDVSLMAVELSVFQEMQVRMMELEIREQED